MAREGRGASSLAARLRRKGRRCGREEEEESPSWRRGWRWRRWRWEGEETREAVRSLRWALGEEDFKN